MWRDLPAPVTTSSATTSDGRPLHFVYNWGFQPSAVNLPVAADDPLTGEPYKVGSSLRLGPWDAKVLVQRG